jgi:hypothetical protein
MPSHRGRWAPVCGCRLGIRAVVLGFCRQGARSPAGQIERLARWLLGGPAEGGREMTVAFSSGGRACGWPASCPSGRGPGSEVAAVLLAARALQANGARGGQADPEPVPVLCLQKMPLDLEGFRRAPTVVTGRRLRRGRERPDWGGPTGSSQAETGPRGTAASAESESGILLGASRLHPMAPGICTLRHTGLQLVGLPAQLYSTRST